MMNLLLGLGTITACLFVQGLLVVMALRFFARRLDRVHQGFLAAMQVTAGLLLILILGSLAQVTVWAALFTGLGEFPDLAAAFYHSAVNFATLGYGDIVMSEEHRILGPLEALNGALMIGVSTAALSRAFQVVLKVSSPSL